MKRFLKKIVTHIVDFEYAYYFLIILFIFLLLLFVIVLSPIIVPSLYICAIKYYAIVFDCSPQEYPVFRQALRELVRTRDRDELDSKLSFTDDFFAFGTKRAIEWAATGIRKNGIPCRVKRLGIRRPKNRLQFEPEDFLSEPEDFLLWLKVSR